MASSYKKQNHVFTKQVGQEELRGMEELGQLGPVSLIINRV